MPVKKISKKLKDLHTPPPEVKSNFVTVALVATIVLLVVMIGIIHLHTDELKSKLNTYIQKEARELELKTFEYSCEELKRYNSGFIFINGECYSRGITLYTRKEVEEAIRHYELGSGK